MTVVSDAVITLIPGTDKAMVTLSYGDKLEQTTMVDINDKLYEIAIHHHGRTRN